MIKIELATGELKRLVAWGLDYRRCATLQALREVAGVPEIATEREAGEKVMSTIISGIASIKRPHIFEGRLYEAHRIRWGHRVLLKLERPGEDEEIREYRLRTGQLDLKTDSAPMRRYYVITTVLKLSGHTAEQWRRYTSPERDLLRILATHIYGGCCPAGEMPIAA